MTIYLLKQYRSSNLLTVNAVIIN